MWFWIQIFVAIICVVYYYFTRTFNYWKTRNVSGPVPIPFFGNIKEMALRKKHQAVAIKDIYDQFPTEKIVGIYRMTTPTLMLRDLDVIKQVMIKDFDMFVDRGIDFSREGLGANLFHADADTWRVLRNRFTPMFTSGKLKKMFPLIIERSDIFMKYLEELRSENSELQMDAIVRKYTISTIAACAFGIDIDMYNPQMKFLDEIGKKIFATNFAFELDMMYPGILMRLNSSLFPKEVSNFFYNLVDTIVKQRDGKPSSRNDFMDLLLEMKQTGKVEGSKRHDNEILSLDLTTDLIAAQAFVFYAAGFETSSTSIAFLLYHLALNPNMQNKLIEEIDEVISRNDGQLRYESLNEMLYLAKLFDENLRMYPVVDQVQRRSKEDYPIPGTNVTIKKDQVVVVPLYSVHRDEKHYPNPDVFDPERFSPEQIRSRHSLAYMPFGSGPRNCIGKFLLQVFNMSHTLDIMLSKTSLISLFRIKSCGNFGTRSFSTNMRFSEQHCMMSLAL